MFDWKGHRFKIAVLGSGQNNLEIKWRSIIKNSAIDCNGGSGHSAEDHREGQCFNGDSNDKDCSPSESADFPHNDVFCLGNYNGKILSTGYSFDHSSFCKVPVILTKLENLTHESKGASKWEPNCFEGKNVCHEKRVKLLLLGIVENNTKSLTNGREEIRFSIVPLRIFCSTKLCKWFSSNSKSVRFISDYGIFHLDVCDGQTNFQILFGHQKECVDMRVQNFNCDINYLNLIKSDIILLDVYNSFVNKTVLAVIQWTDAESSKKCGAYMFRNICNSKYKMKKVDMDLLYPSQFVEIVDKLAIMSLLTTNSSFSIRSAGLIVLTTTKFLLQFVDGIIVKKIASKTTCDFDACVLMNWTNQKKMASNDVNSTGIKSKDVFSSLAVQEKKCQIDAMEVENNVRRKEVFLKRQIQYLSDDVDNSCAGLIMELHHTIPLVSLIPEHTEKGNDNNQHISAGMPLRPRQCHFQVKRLWKQVISNHLVCGVQLVTLNRNKSEQICDAYITLVPINPCQRITKSKSSLVCKLCSHHHSSSSSSSSSFPSSLTFTAALNTENFWGCEDIDIQVYLVYTVLNEPDCARDCLKMNCGRVSLSQRDKLENPCCLNLSMRKQSQGKDFLNVDDIAALDCVQSSFDLYVSSVLTPVTSLLEKVKSDPSIIFVPSLEQFVFSDRLNLCRLKWLKHFNSHTAVIRLFSINQDDLLLLINFLEVIFPSDVHFHLPPTDLSVKSTIAIVQREVEKSMLELNTDL